MSAPTETVADNRVLRIRKLHCELEAIGKTALEKAVEAGTLLREAKAELRHGQWMPWLKDNFEFSDRTARRYMTVAEADEAGKLDMVSDLTEAYEMTSHPSFGGVKEMGGLKFVVVGGKKQDPQTKHVSVTQGDTLQAEDSEPEDTDDEQEVEVEDEEVPEPEPLVVDFKRKRLPKYEPDDAERLWAMAWAHLEKITKEDVSREDVLKEVIAYCEKRLEEKR